MMASYLHNVVNLALMDCNSYMSRVITIVECFTMITKFDGTMLLVNFISYEYKIHLSI